MKKKSTHVAALALFVALSGSLWAQDVVRLKNGEVLVGTLETGGDAAAGLRIRLWDTGGLISVSWDQMPPSEQRRFASPSEVRGDILGDELQGIRVLTSSQEVIGLLEREADSALYIKTAARPAAIPIPLNAVLERETIPIREADAYSPEERVQRRASAVAPGDAAGLLETAELARGLRLFTAAKTYYEQARKADPGRAAEIDRLIELLAPIIREDEAGRALVAIRALIEDQKFDEARQRTAEWLQTYEGTQTASAQNGLLEQIDADIAAFKTNQDKFLSQRVVKEWEKARKSILGRYASDRKLSLDDARQRAEGLDAEVRKAVATKLKGTEEDVARLWEARERKKATASYGSGSWIILGGQDGGPDYTFEETPSSSEDDAIKDFDREFGGMEDKKESKYQLQTSAEWWQKASSSIRSDWLEAYAAEHSPLIEAQQEKRACRTCNGEGFKKGNREGKRASIFCARCHGAKEEITVGYQ